ncbi:MAG: sensor histidine kinase, partial [Muribaculaceae bacterium]
VIYLFALGVFRDTTVDWAGTILNDIIILMGVEMVYYFRRLSKARQEAEEARLLAVQYRYDALKSQINPHFLFNSLNLLYSLVSIDTVRSKHFIRELSRMYRYIMAQQNRECVSVAEEFDFLTSYVSVLEMRYNNKFKVKIEGQPASDRYIIPFTMQLLIENITKHNAITAKSPMDVTIAITEEEIVISNPVYPRETESVSHFGLRYISQLYGSHGKVFRVEKDNNKFTAHVPIL